MLSQRTPRPRRRFSHSLLSHHVRQNTTALPACDDRRALRRTLRQRRRALGHRDQYLASMALTRQLMQQTELRRARHVALYLPENGEIDPTPLVDWLHQRGARVYLPVLRPLVENRLWFVHWRFDTRLVLNRFNITEPDLRQSGDRVRRIAPWALDVVLMPLVGFDEQGHRLGMGGGFYDRTLAFAAEAHGPRPTLVGVAHACQQVERLPHQPWDVNLDMIVSDQRVLRPHTARA
ncbi:5-formyltetrahydrofolate cyclo-ligase [Kushneria pakistanensis]|uniref:5-formyltetrahydrofolate cyclo-ligase n=1 Tax=Kushneria pakistanensis TaxID=1508770 RepID=A0ABQ3FHY4_9GAMM|nr:5-formyltetrahydrofolate cyclo-ligase [Kushneria pakistanensis]